MHWETFRGHGVTGLRSTLASFTSGAFECARVISLEANPIHCDTKQAAFSNTAISTSLSHPRRSCGEPFNILEFWLLTNHSRDIRILKHLSEGHRHLQGLLMNMVLEYGTSKILKVQNNTLGYWGGGGQRPSSKHSPQGKSSGRVCKQEGKEKGNLTCSLPFTRWLDHCAFYRLLSQVPCPGLPALSIAEKKKHIPILDHFLIPGPNSYLIKICIATRITLLQHCHFPTHPEGIL